MKNPHSRFRQITVLPKEYELRRDSKPYLRPNKVIGAYDDVEHYLDTHFRLMREDMFRYLRKSVAEYKCRIFDTEKSAALEAGHVYFNIKIQGRKYSNGIYLLTTFYLNKEVNWSTTERLKPMSFLCLSNDGFKTFVFARLSSRSTHASVSSSCEVELALENTSQQIDSTNSYDVIETDSFYQNYEYVLKRLQFFTPTNFPLPACIISLQTCNEKPAYWKEDIIASCNGSDQSLSEFDEHQQKAFLMAISSKVSLIQGPPGTGKTFLGLQIVKWLVENVSKHTGTPIVVLCKTNHALDQFLEGALGFTEKVLRVGCQSKSAILKPYNLQKVADATFKREITEDARKSQALLELLSTRIGYYNPYCRLVKFLEGEINDLVQASQDIDENLLCNEKTITMVLPEIWWFQSLGIVLSSDLRAYDIFVKWAPTALEKWLCLTPPLTNEYKKLPGILFLIVKELFEHNKENNLLNEEMESEENYSNDNMFLVEIFEAFLSDNFYPTDINDDFLFYKSEECEINIFLFLKKRKLQRQMIFNLVKTAVFKHLSELDNGPTASDLKTNALWSLNILDRWRLLQSWMLNAKDLYSNSLEDSVRSYNLAIEKRDSVKYEFKMSLVKNADIVGLTMTGAGKHWKLLEEIGPRIAVVDEAAEALEAHIVTALNHKTEHLILIGDHKQLRPNSKVFELAKSYNLCISMFERLLNNGVPFECLQTQHRMRPCIAGLLVPEIYEKLNNHPCVLEYEDIKGVTQNMYFVSHKMLEDCNENRHKHSNKHEALFIVSLCRYLVQQGYEEGNITVLALYSGQVTLLKSLMNMRGLNIKVTSADNFQGEENDIILLSFVRSNKENVIGFLKTDNRICVAFSRAKKALYCIGNFEFFSTHCQIWNKIVEKLTEMGVISQALPLTCQNHPESITLVSSEEDFKKVQYGGCSEKCTYQLACGHSCPLFCHPSTNHDNITCDKDCTENDKEKFEVETNSENVRCHNHG